MEQTGPLGQEAGQKLGLVESTLPPAGPMQRNMADHIRLPPLRTSLIGLQEEARQGPGEPDLPSELVMVKEDAERTGVFAVGRGPGKVNRPVATGRAERKGFRQSWNFQRISAPGAAREMEETGN